MIQCLILGDYKILVIGGNVATTLAITGNAEVIDMSSYETSCSAFASLLTPISALMGGYDHDKNLIVCGGYTDEKHHIPDCYNYNEEQKEWIQYLPGLVVSRGWTTMTCSPFNISPSCFVIGGTGQNSNYSGQTAEYLSETGWEKVPSVLSESIGFLCSVFYNSTSLLVIGGKNRNAEVLKKTYFLDIKSFVFSDGPLLITSRHRHSCGRILTGNTSQYYTVIVVGGETIKNDPMNLVEVFDYQQNMWRQGTALPQKISRATIVEDPLGGVVLLGGNSPSVKGLNTIYQLANGDPSTKWVLMTQKLRIGRYQFAALIVPNMYANCSKPI